MHPAFRSRGVGLFIWFGTIFGMKNGTESWACGRQLNLFKITPDRLAEASDQDALPMLRHKAACIDHFVVNVIAKLVLERLANHPEGISAIMAEQIFDIFEQKGLWPLL